MMLKRLLMIFALGLGFAGIIASQGIASGGSEKVSADKEKVVICGQQTIDGYASGSYADGAKCTADKKNLQDKAIQDGKDRCDKFCKGMSCNPPKYPTIKASASCKTVGGKTYGSAKTTTPITCRCTQ